MNVSALITIYSSRATALNIVELGLHMYYPCLSCSVCAILLLCDYNEKFIYARFHIRYLRLPLHLPVKHQNEGSNLSKTKIQRII